MSDPRVLKSGQTVTLRPLDGITERQRRKARLMLQRLSPPARVALESGNNIGLAEAFSENDAQIMYELNDLVAIEQIEAWSWSVPVSADALVDLPARDYEEILAITAPGIAAFFGIDFSPTPDPASPTHPSDA